jgi:hypothetical protein
MYLPGRPMLYGNRVIPGPKVSCRMSLAPVMMSPPTKFGLSEANCEVAVTIRPIDADRLVVEVALLLCQWYGVPVAGADSSPARR